MSTEALVVVEQRVECDGNRGAVARGGAILTRSTIRPCRQRWIWLREYERIFYTALVYIYWEQVPPPAALDVACWNSKRAVAV